MSKHHATIDPSKPVIVSTPVFHGGPPTPDGRAISSRNATRHGCCSASALILPNENIDDYYALEATWFSAYKPHEEAEKRLVQQLVDADWFLERANRTLAQVEADIFNSGYQPLIGLTISIWNSRASPATKTARANAVTKCRKAIEDCRKNRAGEKMKSKNTKSTKRKASYYR